MQSVLIIQDELEPDMEQGSSVVDREESDFLPQQSGMLQRLAFLHLLTWSDYSFGLLKCLYYSCEHNESRNLQLQHSKDSKIS